MHLNRQARIQLVIFTVIALIALTVMGLRYMKLPAKLFGIGHHVVAMELPEPVDSTRAETSPTAVPEVGRVQAVRLTKSGVIADLALKSGIDIPGTSGRKCSQSAIGEQYVELLPRNATSPPLRNGDVIALKDTSVPQDINSVLDAVKTGLQAIPRATTSRPSSTSPTAVGGLGAELSTIVDGTTRLSIDARDNLDPLLALIDNAKPVMESQVPPRMPSPPGHPRWPR